MVSDIHTFNVIYIIFMNESTKRSHFEGIFYKAKAFESSFYPWSFKEWGKLKTIFFSFIRAMEISVVALSDTNCLKLLTHLRLNPNH